MFDRFDYESYRALLDMLMREHRNCRFVDVADGTPAGKYFILRHDVDYSPSMAIRMADQEAAWGVRATYFLLLRGECYDLRSAKYCEIPRRLADRGFEVGLHYDVQFYEGCGAVMLDCLHREADALAELSGRPVTSIAMHNPSVYGKDPFADVTDFVNAYDPRFTKQIAYFSDSRGAWRDATVAALQLLVHPLFWDHHHADRYVRLAEALCSENAAIQQLREHICQNWAASEIVRQHDARIGMRLSE